MPLVSSRPRVAALDERQAARDLSADAVAPWALKYPAVEVDTTVVDGSAPGR